MRTIQILTLFAILLTATIFATQASACPRGYFQCGGACCPR
jgi:hypothetical protein